MYCADGNGDDECIVQNVKKKLKYIENTSIYMIGYDVRSVKYIVLRRNFN